MNKQQEALVKWAQVRMAINHVLRMRAMEKQAAGVPPVSFWNALTGKNPYGDQLDAQNAAYSKEKGYDQYKDKHHVNPWLGQLKNYKNYMSAPEQMPWKDFSELLEQDIPFGLAKARKNFWRLMPNSVKDLTGRTNLENTFIKGTRAPKSLVMDNPDSYPPELESVGRVIHGISSPNPYKKVHTLGDAFSSLSRIAGDAIQSSPLNEMNR